MTNEVLNTDFLSGVKDLEDGSVDLFIADPPYSLGKDYGNSSDRKRPGEYLAWMEKWLILSFPKLKNTGSLYIFLSWQYSPEIFSFIKKHLIMLNEIIWDRKVPSMGGGTRKYSSVHDNIGFFSKTKNHYFDLDSIRIPYDEKTRKARTRSIFVGKKWLEIGYNPKDVWSVSRLHRLHREREDHPTQKPVEIVERIVKASSPEGGLVVDPFAGSGTTAEACAVHGRNCISYEINSDYCAIISDRINRAKKESRQTAFIENAKRKQNSEKKTDANPPCELQIKSIV